MSNTWWRDVDELVKEQADLLDIPTDEDLLIKGPPGSGKTNLLLLRANQLYLGDRPNLHVVVFGSLLKQFIQLGGLQYKFPQDKIVTHTRLFTDILRAEGASFDAKGMKLEDARAERASRLSILIDEGKVGKQFDALLLDEAQDYTPLEIRLLRSLTEVLVATADARQKIYDVEDCIADLENFKGTVYPLKYHFRNGLEICRLADGIQKGVPGFVPLQQHSNYNEKDYPSKVLPKPSLTIEDQAVAIAAQIKDQRFAYPDDLIGVLCPRNEELNAIAEGLIKAGLGSSITRANSDLFDPTQPIWLSTLTAAKGLEFRAVHIAGLDFLYRTGGAQKRLIYTGITRAKTALTLYWHKSIPGYLESALLTVTPSKKPVTKQNIFGKS
jgi:superfamily I DNA/RNA helicase